MCMREGEATWRTYFAGFDLSMFAIRISDTILSLLRTAAPVEDAKGEPVAWPHVLQIGGVTSSDFGNSAALRVRFGLEKGPWEWRKPTDDEYQRMLAGVNNPQSHAPSHSGNLRDFTTHRASWRKAIEQARDYAPLDDGESNDRLYWDHELKAFDKAFDALAASQSDEAALKAREALRAREAVNGEQGGANG